MNRREALAALVAMPQVARISAVPAANDDVLVVECDRPISREEADRMRQQFEQIWPARKVAILDGGLRIKLAPK